MARYPRVFCGSYSLETGTRVISSIYILIYLINISLNVLILDIVKAYKENVDKDLEYNENNLQAFHYICLAFGILTILLAITTLVNVSRQSEYFMEFIFQCNIFRCIMLFIGIVYVCVAMKHILTVSLSTSMLVIDLCFSCYATGIIASFSKSLGHPHDLKIQESDNAKPGDVHLISHKKASDLGQDPPVKVVAQTPPNDTCEMDGGIENTGLDSGEREVKEQSPLSCDGNSKEPTKAPHHVKAPQVETEGEVSEPNEEKALDTNPESTTVLVHAESKDSIPSEKRDDHVSVFISENNSTVNKEQNAVTINVDPKHSHLDVSDSDPIIHHHPTDVGLKNPAFEVADSNQQDTVDHPPSDSDLAIETPRGGEAVQDSDSADDVVGIKNPKIEVVGLCTGAIAVNVNVEDEEKF